MKWIPHAYQAEAERFGLTHSMAALFLDMGLGKTVISLSLVDKLTSGLNIDAALVVAPIRVIEDVWPQEAKKWDHSKDLRLSLIRGTAKQREEALNRRAHIYLINYELLPWLIDLIRKRAKSKRNPWRPPFDMVILDESSKMKSPSAKRFKKFKLFRPQFVKRVLLLTGTPRPNSSMDLWAQVWCMDMGERLGPHFGLFRDRWFTFNQYTYETKIKPGADKQIRKRIADICLSMKAEDYLKLPRLITNVVRVPLSRKVMTQYREFEKELLLKLEKTDVEAFNAASLSMKCRQITSGAIYDDDTEKRKGGERQWHKLHDAKMDAVRDIVDDAQGDPVLIVYEFKHELARLRKMFPKAPWIGGGSKGASKAITEWNKGKHRVMLVHPASVGHGTNLQHGGHIMLWTSMTWSLELFQQMFKRLHRQGQTKPVFVHLLVAPGTVDEDVRDTLALKERGQSDFLEFLKARIRKRQEKP